jgi:hypothetical protein
VNEIVNDLREKYLGFAFPREVREMLARIVAENEASSNREGIQDH